MGHPLLSLVFKLGSYLWEGQNRPPPFPQLYQILKSLACLRLRAQFDLFILKLCTLYDFLGANNTTCKTNNLIQNNRSVFLLLQNYSQAFFLIEISNVTFAAIFAGGHSTVTFTERRRDKLYQKYLRDKISVHKNYHNSFKNRKPQNVWEKGIIVTL